MSARAHESEASAKERGQQDEELLAQTSRLYYLEDKSKVEIGHLLGISRFKVARLLTAARDRGIVQIAITVPGRIDSALSVELVSLFAAANGVLGTAAPPWLVVSP